MNNKILSNSIILIDKDTGENISTSKSIDYNYKYEEKKAIKFCLLANIVFTIASLFTKIFAESNSIDTAPIFGILRQLGISMSAFIYNISILKVEIKSLLYFYNINFITKRIYNYFGIILFDKNIINENNELFYNQDIYNKNNKIIVWMTIRIFSLFFGSLLILIGVHNLKQAYVTVIICTYPIISNLLSPIIINQPLRIKYIIACFMCLLGIIIMVSNQQSDISTNNNNKKSIVIGSISTFGFAFIISLTNFSLITLKEDYDVFNINYVTSMLATILGILYILIVYDISYLFNNLTIINTFYGLLNGTLMFMCYMFLYLAFFKVELSKSVYISYIQIPIMSLYGYVFFNETLVFTDYLGGLIILGTVILTSLVFKDR